MGDGGMMKLRDYAQIHTGYTFRGSLKERTQGNTAIIQTGDATQEGVAQPDQFARAQLDQLPAHYLLCPGDLIFRARGLVNTCALITEPLVRTICIAPLIFIRIVVPTELLPAYLQWFINLPGTQKQIDTFARGSTVRMISVEAMMSLNLVVPTLETQKEIIATTQLQQQILLVETELVQKRHHYTEQALLQYAKANLIQACA